MKVALIGPTHKIDPLVCLLSKYCDFLCVDYTIDVFSDIDEVNENNWDIIFPYISDDNSDVILKLSSFENSELVLWSDNEKGALAGIKTHAKGFILLPCNETDFISIMERCKAFIKNVKGFCCGKGVNLRNVRNIEITYIRSLGHNVVIHTLKDEYTINNTLANLISVFDKGFIQCHRCYIVNMRYVKMIDEQNIILIDDTIIPITPLKLLENREIIEGYIADHECYINKWFR